MRLLLDTHFAVWLVSEPEKMPDRARDLILDPANLVAASMVAIWEVSIKHSKRLREGRGGLMPGTILLERLIEAGIDLLSISAAHASAVNDLPMHHSDPFDRMLIAQARSEPMRLLTVDRTLSQYGDAVLLV